jgi:hypothetical protein
MVQKQEVNLWRLHRYYSKCHVTSNKAKSNLEYAEKVSDKGVGSGVFVTTGRLSLLTPSNPPPCLKFFFCVFKVTLGLVRSYVTLAIHPWFMCII